MIEVTTIHTESQQIKSDVGFSVRGEKPAYLSKNLTAIREKGTNNISPHVKAGQEIEPGLNWWQTSALTTALTLLSMQCIKKNDIK